MDAAGLSDRERPGCSCSTGGRRVWTFDEKWRKATVAAHLPGRLFHDYRRTAVRDLIRAGVPQAVAMTMTGHKTEAVFRRYNITDDRDKREAVRKLSAYRETRKVAANVVPFMSAESPRREFGHDTGTICHGARHEARRGPRVSLDLLCFFGSGGRI